MLMFKHSEGFAQIFVHYLFFNMFQLCVRAADALMKLCGCTGSAEPSIAAHKFDYSTNLS